MRPTRETVLATLFAALGTLAAVVLFEVVPTVVLAVTLAYVLFPVRQWLSGRGVSDYAAAAATTTVAGVGALALVSPVMFVLYQRRAAAIRFVRSLPDELIVPFAGETFVIPTEPLVERATGLVGELAVTVASVAPVLVLEAVVLVLIVFALLYRPQQLRLAVTSVVPSDYHDVVAAYHRRTRRTLQAIYVLQAATAVGTFLLAFVVFFGLGYQSPVFLAVVAGVLQFVPILGPSVLVLTLAAVELTAGDTVGAILVTVIGLIVVGFLPDAVIRTRLAGYAAGLPVSLYFVGFVGGVLTVGAVGFVLGPLVVALLAETVSLLSARADADPPLTVESAAGTHPSESPDDPPTTDRSTRPDTPDEPTESADDHTS